MTVAKAVPLTVMASASSVPSMSASPDMSKEAAIISPDTSTAPLISTVGATICNSTSAAISNCPSVLELIKRAVSRNSILPAPAVVLPTAKTSASVSSLLGLTVDTSNQLLPTLK